MATTYTLIASNTLSSATSSVTFSSIPGTYTDLVLRWSARNSDGSAITTRFLLRVNGSSSTIYSDRMLLGNGTTASSEGYSAQDANYIRNAVNGTSTTANTFSNGEIYIPQYATTANKQIGTFATIENNATTSGITAHAGLIRVGAAITSLSLTLESTNLAIGSSFYLYGIKNS